VLLPPPGDETSALVAAGSISLPGEVRRIRHAPHLRATRGPAIFVIAGDRFAVGAFAGITIVAAR
jgi:hypothetical protein